MIVPYQMFIQDVFTVKILWRSLKAMSLILRTHLPSKKGKNWHAFKSTLKNKSNNFQAPNILDLFSQSRGDVWTVPRTGWAEKRTNSELGSKLWLTLCARVALYWTRSPSSGGISMHRFSSSPPTTIKQSTNQNRVFDCVNQSEESITLS